ncbi:hypothetical protein ACMHYB_60070 [Sorangium sp. So ce1128]
MLSGRSGGRHPTSSRGQLAKGLKTRTNNRTGRMISTKGEAAMVFQAVAMRRSPQFALLPLLLLLVLLEPACGASGAPASRARAPGPPTSVDRPPSHSSLPPPPAEEPKPAGPVACFATPVTFGKGRGLDRFAPKPISADLPAKLAACPGEREPLECQYEIARAYFEANHFAEAGAIFRGVARAGSNHKLTIYAAQLYLESLNVLGSQAEPPRPACYDDMAAEVPALHASLCGSKPKPDSIHATSSTGPISRRRWPATRESRRPSLAWFGEVLGPLNHARATSDP